MDINDRGLKLLYEFEGRHEKLPDGRYRAYLDKIASPPVWTLYAGLTKGIREGMIVTEAQGDAMVRKELNIYEDAIERLVKVPLTSNQFSALTCLVYNIGIGAFTKSTLLKVLNQGRLDLVPAQFMRWDKAGGKTIKGLARRRKAELALFLEPDEIEAIIPPDPMPQRVEPSNPPVAEVIKNSGTAQVSILGMILGALQQGWTWTVGLFKDAGAEAVTTQQAIGPFDALLKAVGANLPQITIAILMATLLIVLVRKINAGKA
jgi:lysozyme